MQQQLRPVIQSSDNVTFQTHHSIQNSIIINIVIHYQFGVFLSYNNNEIQILEAKV